MIWESSYWKNDLLREMDQVNELLSLSEPQPDEEIDELETRKGVGLEKFMFLSAYIVRKLLEAFKLSDEVEGTKLTIGRYPRIPSSRNVPYYDRDPLDFLSAHRIEKFYRLDAPEKVTMNIKGVVNQLVHSFIFVPQLSISKRDCETVFNGVLFNSEKTKGDWLFSLQLQDWQDFIQRVAHDDIVEIIYSRRDDSLVKLSPAQASAK